MKLYINGRFTTQTLTGVQRFATELTRALQAQETDYILLTPAGGAASWPGAQEFGKCQGQMWEQLDLPRASSDGVLINLGNTGPILARQQLIVIHDTGVFSTPEAYSNRFRNWYKILQMILIRSETKIVTVSNFSKLEILRHFTLDESRVSIIPEGVDHIFRIQSDVSVVAQHGLEPERYVLGIGTPAAHKNLFALDDLANRLHDRGMRLVLAGCIKKEVFQSVKMPQKALYVGRVSDGQLKALYENASCFVFPSRYEGYGLPPLEAMACGCPVVASDIPVLREICGEAAQFCDSFMPIDISSKVMAIIDSSYARQELRRTGLAHVGGLTWKCAAAELHACIQREMAFERT